MKNHLYMIISALNYRNKKTTPPPKAKVKAAIFTRKVTQSEQPLSKV
jgi:hypothetical protein